VTGGTGLVSRRGFLLGAGGLGLLALVPASRLAALAAAAPSAGQAGRFLTAHELDTLRAVTGQLIPGPPLDDQPGAIEAGCAEAIDLMLGAFTVQPPLIHPGGPFSNRAGSPVDDMAMFVPLDALAELGWRIRLEGSQGRPEREFAGPVIGLQQIYRDGLAHLDARARALIIFPDFVSLPGPFQLVILADLTDAAVQTFLGAALANTLEAMYGVPEYGGNRNLVGWTTTGWPGDVQPRGYTAAEVSGPWTSSTPPLALADAQLVLQDLFARLGSGPVRPHGGWPDPAF
jgi:Gluconate 2-dehydrogenase subunit 3